MMNGKRSPDGFQSVDPFAATPAVILAALGKQKMTMLTPRVSLEDQATDPKRILSR
jgi:hypothetical protein